MLIYEKLLKVIESHVLVKLLLLLFFFFIYIFSLAWSKFLFFKAQQLKTKQLSRQTSIKSYNTVKILQMQTREQSETVKRGRLYCIQ